MLHSICQQIWKRQQWPQDWKRSVSFLSQRKTKSKNVQTTIQLSSFHMLAELCSKSFKLGFSSTWTNHLPCLLRNLQVKKQQLQLDMEHWTGSKFRKELFLVSFFNKIQKCCVLSPCLFNLYAEYIRRNARLDESQAGIKIAGGNINNLRYVDYRSEERRVGKECRSRWSPYH